VTSIDDVNMSELRSKSWKSIAMRSPGSCGKILGIRWIILFAFDMPHASQSVVDIVLAFPSNPVILTPREAVAMCCKA
jgi:hypothetical protein